VLKFITDCLQYVSGVVRHGFITICQNVNGDQCNGSTCLDQTLRNSPAGRGMTFVFWDRQGVVLVNSMSQGHNVNADLLYVIV